MHRGKRKLYLDVCDYEGNTICNLYDNSSDISGQATDVFVTTERNGWKELSFTIPSVCITEEGEEENYRLQYLIADYRIRLVDDYETDWYLISEPKIQHNNYAKNVTVTAGHICQLLKFKNLDLEFSDEEGNNVGTCEQILDTILEGTGWTAGEVVTFMEDDGSKEKVRSMNASAKSGAFKLVSDLCELFEAKAIYHGDKTVDILPMNPFSRDMGYDTSTEKITAGAPVTLKAGDIPNIFEAGNIPEEKLNSQIFEIHYGKNMKGISRTLNTENIVTKLTAYGDYGDVDLGMCTLRTVTHKEYIFNITTARSSGTEFRFQDYSGVYYYFTCFEAITENTKLIWSCLDFASKSYVWNDKTQHAYYVYKKPKGAYISLSYSEIQDVVNEFPYIMDFDYYQKIGLLTDNMFQTVAKFQRNTPELLRQSTEASQNFSSALEKLSAVGESNSGYLKLNVKRYSKNTTVYIPDEQVNELVLELNGVEYRSDYMEKRRNYFPWRVAHKLKANGEPTSGGGSIVYIIHDTNPVTWEKAYVKAVDFETETVVTALGETVTQFADYKYENHSNDPQKIMLHLDYGKLGVTIPYLSSTDEFYLFASNSMSGSLGGKEVEIEGVLDNLDQATMEGTVSHPTYFEDYRNRNTSTGKPSTSTSAVQGQGMYGWCYLYHANTLEEGEIYFCYGNNGETTWNRCYFSDADPTCVNGAYYFNTKYKTLYHGESNQWILWNASKQKRIARNFSKVYYYCLRYDWLHKGLYEKYKYTATKNLVPGNYVIKGPYAFYWAFTTDMPINKNKTIYIDTTSSHLYQTDNIGDIVSVTVKPYDTLEFPKANELISANYFEGSIDPLSGKEISLEESHKTGFVQKYRSSFIDVYPGVTYQYKLPANSLIAFYSIDSTKEVGKEFEADEFIESYSIGGTGTFTTPALTKHIRIVCNFADENTLKSYITNTGYIRVNDYSNVAIFGDNLYTILSPYTTDGQLNGLDPLMKKFKELSNSAYGDYLPAQQQAQAAVKEATALLSEILGDIYREGEWHETKYVEGDEEKLYKDALDNLGEVAKPEAKYDIDFLDLYASEDTDEEELCKIDWPDIHVTDGVHLIDTDIDIGLWAYIDKLKKCYDKPWLTKPDINTNLSLIGQHDFTDVMTKIAEVANETKNKQSVYMRAAALTGSGKLATDRLEGAISANVNAILGGASNYYTDEKGRLVFESVDGTSAMMLTGAGWMIASEKDSDGNWKWRSTATGHGITADSIYTGYLSAVLIEAGSITADKLNASVGQELEIGSNKALSLYATSDGTKPAGQLKTTDGRIIIRSGDPNPANPDNREALIEIASGGRIDISAGSTLKMESGSDMDITAGGTFTLQSGGNMSIESGGELHISTPTKGKLTIDSPNFKVKQNGDVEISGKITATSGNIAGFEINTSGSIKYMYAGNTTSITSTGTGVYIGTDGINISNKFIMSTDGTNAKFTANASNIFLGDITGFTTLAGKLGDMDSKTSAAQKAADDAQDAADDAQNTANSKSQTYTTTWDTLKTKQYVKGDVWIDTEDAFNWQYICNKSKGTSPSKNDWTLVSTGITEGAALKVDAINGNIDVAAANEIRIAAGTAVRVGAGQTLTLAVGNYTSGGKTYSGTVQIGHGSNLFTVGCNETNAYIYNGISSLSVSGKPVGTKVTGIYMGTDGINVGNVFQVKSTGDTQMSVNASNILLGDITGYTNLGTKIGAMDTATSTAQGTANNAVNAAANAQSDATSALHQSTTFYGTTASMTGKTYYVGNTWTCTDTKKDKNNNDVCYYYIYTCKTGRTNATAAQVKTDWILTGTNLVGGAGIAIDAESGIIDIISANGAINIVSGATIDIAANKKLSLSTNGAVEIGHGSKPFVISGTTGTNGHAYMYADLGNNSLKVLTPSTAFGTNVPGIYIGSDGINIGNKFKFDTSGNGSMYIDASNIKIGSDKTVSSEISRVDGKASDAATVASNAQNTANSAATAAAAARKVAEGTFFSIDADAGTFVISADSSLSIAANKSIKMITNANGTIKLGADGKEFIFGATSSKAHIYNGKTSLSSTSSGVYLGTDGISVGNSTSYIKIDPYATSGNNLEVKGYIAATGGSIGGWTIGSNYIGSASTLGDSKVGISNRGDNDYAFWAGGIKGSDTSLSSAKFSVTKAGALNATEATITGTIISNAATITGGSITLKDLDDNVLFSANSSGVKVTGQITTKTGKIGGWYVGTNWMGNKNTWAKCSVGFFTDVASNNNSIIFFAGDTDEDDSHVDAPFYITQAGSMFSTKGTIGGWTISSDKITADSSKAGLCSTTTYTSGNKTYAETMLWAGGAQRSAPFRVNSNGTVYTSKLQAVGGTIGGFTINSNYIGSGSTLGDSKVGISNREDNDYAFWAGGERYSDTSLKSATFSVTKSGTLNAERATIAGWTTTNGWFYKGDGVHCVCLSDHAHNSGASAFYSIWAGADWPDYIPEGSSGTGYAPFSVKVMPDTVNINHGYPIATVYATHFYKQWYTYENEEWVWHSVEINP